jgi:23S rRNA (uracil1939-C5)-methyltransferase
MPTLARVTVESIAAGGNGVARSEGMAVFVPRTAPGDVADVNITPHGRFGRGELVRLLSPGAVRVTPRCQHYAADRCGGCQLQHLAYGAQLEVKRCIIRDALQRIARRDVELPTIFPSPTPWEYRAKLTLTMRRESGSWVFGLHAYDDPARIFPLRECPITEPALLAAWREIHGASGCLPPARELRGAVRRIGDELAFYLDGATEWTAAREFARRAPLLRLIRWKPAGGEARIVVDRRDGDAPTAAFEQVNASVATELRTSVVNRALAMRPASAVDAYAGSGATSRMLAERGVHVTAIELDADAAQYAASRAPTGLTVRLGRVEDVLPEVLPVDTVILNPPRAGLDKRVTQILESRKPPRHILYVSCDPATLARDIARMPSYRIAGISAYDMFPQTAHVETLCELIPEDA